MPTVPRGPELGEKQGQGHLFRLQAGRPARAHGGGAGAAEEGFKGHKKREGGAFGQKRQLLWQRCQR